MKHFSLFFCVVCLSLSLQGCQSGKSQSKSEFVDIFIGTANDQGQLDPSATVPYGMIKVTPDCIKPSHVGYDYDKERISGFSINRISGAGCRGAGGNLSVKPALAEEEITILKETEKGCPGYYTATLSNRVEVELTATHNVAIERFRFEPSALKHLFINLSTSFAKIAGYNYTVESPQQITGSISARNPCDNGLYTFHFNATFNHNFQVEKQDSATLLLSFQHDEVEMRIAVSPIDTNTAQKEGRLIENRSFEEIKAQAESLWNEKLSVVEVSGNDSVNKMFYTMLYRCFQSPVDDSSSDSLFIDTKGELQKAKGYKHYNSWSIWDTYRTKFPLLCLLDAKGMSDFSQSLSHLYLSGKENWSTPHESCPTIRTEHASITLLDAYRKGVKGIRFTEIFDSLVAETRKMPLISPDNYLETAYDYWALSEIAGIVGNTDKQHEYKALAANTWRSKWIEKFKVVNDSTFDIMHGDGLYEGTLWQYRWAVPYDIDGLAEEAGGAEKLSSELNYFFEQGLYNHGNQPDIHAAYLFNRLGKSKLTQYWVNQIMNQPMEHWYGTHHKNEKPYFDLAYKPLPGAYIPEMDDDDGTMAAWYVLSAIGLYPLTPGVPEYEITRPLFPKVSIRLANNCTFTIECENFGNDFIYIEQLLLNGKPLGRSYLKHDEILNGGTLKLILSKS